MKKTMNQLRPIGKEIWLYEGSTVSFHGFPFSTRMTVIRLKNGDLWVHSPEKMNERLREELSALGKVQHLVSPNKLHHLFLREWIDAYPDAITYAAPGLSKKRRDIKFSVKLCEDVRTIWDSEIYQTVFRGSPAMEEVVFYHKPSSTLILTDLIENINPDSLNWWQKRLAGFAGILYPHGKTPVDWRISYIFGSKSKARESLAKIQSWAPENIVLSHGECIFGDGLGFLRTSFSWLRGNA